jgi:hypothetical protein
MSTASDLKGIVSEARPLIEQWLDIAETMSGLREAATEKGLDWSQIKALVKARESGIELDPKDFFVETVEAAE